MLNGLQLIPLFNSGYDYARYDRALERYYGVTNKKKASHRLHCTKWNPNLHYILDVRKRIRAEKTRPSGWALSVCATPIKRRTPRKPSVRLQRPIADVHDRLIYHKAGSLEGKRAVLVAMTKTHRTPTKMARLIKKMGTEKLDRLYRTLRLANKVARRRAARAAARLLRKQKSI